LLFFLTSNLSSASPFAPAKRSTDLLPFRSLGGIAAVIRSPTETQIYYQNPDGGIWAYDSMGSNTFTNSHIFFNDPLVPAEEVMEGTPIEAVQMNFADGSFTIHVFFISPTLTLSEWRFDFDPTSSANTGWFHGPSCVTCITNAGFVVADGPKLAYFLADAPTNLVRVGFVSAGAPGTLSEAVLDASGEWKLTQIPG